MPARKKKMMGATERMPSRGRRRATVHDPLKKGTYQMHASTLEGIRRAVGTGAAANASAFVEDAVLERLRALRRARRAAVYAEAASDQEFMADLALVTRELESTVADGLDEGR